MKRGITLISVLAIFTIIAILTSAVTISAIKTTNDAKKIKFATEVAYITEAINSYYINNQDFPIGESVTIDLSYVSENSITQFSNEEGYSDKKIVLYQIDKSKLGISDTVYGNGDIDSKDIYAVSKDTQKVYYIKGVSVSDITYYTLTEDLKKLVGYELSNNGVKDGTFLKVSESATTSNTSFLGITERGNITKVIFEDSTKNAPVNAIDVSADSNGSIIGWLDGTEVHIASDSNIYANENSSNLFEYMWSLTEIERLDLLNTSKVVDMSNMFYECYKLESLDVSSFDTSSVTNMSGMFKECNVLKSLDLSNFHTSNVTNMSSMFDFCYMLERIDVSNFDTSNVTNMANMFKECRGLKKLDLSNFDTSNVNDMSSMFAFCHYIEKLDISNFDTSNITNMLGMFYHCQCLTTIYASDKFTTNIVDDSAEMFEDDVELVGGKGTEYDASYLDKTYARVDGGSDNPGYFTQKSAISIGDKQKLLTTDGSIQYLYVTVNILSNDEIKCVKFEREIMSKEDALVYFKSNGIELQEDIIEVKEDTKGVTVYLEDITGKVTVVSKEF